jgi:Tannase and feruloyl esterase
MWTRSCLRTPSVVTVWLVLPVEHCNGHFLGLGGGGWLPGFPWALGVGASHGFATDITNVGRRHDLSTSPESLRQMLGQDDFLLDANDRLDWSALENFAYLGIHEMTAIGKAVTQEFYGVRARCAYFSRCSLGRRQGQSDVARRGRRHHLRCGKRALRRVHSPYAGPPYYR